MKKVLVAISLVVSFIIGMFVGADNIVTYQEELLASNDKLRRDVHRLYTKKNNLERKVETDKYDVDHCRDIRKREDARNKEMWFLQKRVEDAENSKMLLVMKLKGKCGK